jgi:hypothetical protein
MAGDDDDNNDDGDDDNEDDDNDNEDDDNDDDDVYFDFMMVMFTSSIMDLHDGHISVASDGEGKGSSFTVKIPMRRHSAHPIIIYINIYSYIFSSRCNLYTLYIYINRERKFFHCKNSYASSFRPPNYHSKAK